VWTACHWTAVTVVALLLAQWAPFDGLYATAATTVIAAGVGLIGLAAAPNINRKDVRP
jgi:tRNA1(Val) A37 N6-methylase TrmN6